MVETDPIGGNSVLLKEAIDSEQTTFLLKSISFFQMDKLGKTV